MEEERLEPWVETLSWKPRIQVMHNLLTHKECEEIIAIGESKLTKSEVVGEGGKNIGKFISDKRLTLAPSKILESSARTSHGLFFDESYMKNSPLLRNVEYRIAKWTQIPRENGESFYLLRYQLGINYPIKYFFLSLLFLLLRTTIRCSCGLFWKWQRYSSEHRKIWG